MAGFRIYCNDAVIANCLKIIVTRESFINSYMLDPQFTRTTRRQDRTSDESA